MARFVIPQKVVTDDGSVLRRRVGCPDDAGDRFRMACFLFFCATQTHGIIEAGKIRSTQEIQETCDTTCVSRFFCCNNRS